MGKLPLKRKRMLRYFIEATQNIIERDGFDNVTIRKISTQAGYNSATLYNYYEDLDHLLQFACVEYLIRYQTKLIQRIKRLTNPKDIYFQTWSLFADECFAHPKVYYHLFFSKHKNQIHQTFYRYLDLFDIEYGEIPSQKVFTFIKLPDLAKRHLILLESMAEQGYIAQDHIKDKADMLILMFESMLNALRSDDKRSKKDFKQSIIQYSKILLGIS